MAVDVGSAVGYLDLDISGFLKGLKSAQSEADKQTKNIATTVGNNISSAGKKLTSIGSTLTKTVTLPIAGAGAAIVKLSADFESAMSKVSAISGATGKDLEALNKKAQEMGAKTKFSATEAAEAFTYMAMAGWKTEAMIEGIDGIMNLAAADGLDLATTSDIVTDALTAFGMEAKDSAHFADVLAKASSSANTNVSMLGESFKYVAPVAGALGYSAEDVALALGLMANAGIKGSQGGTALRASLSRLIKPTDTAAGLMEKYNISLTNSDGTMKSLADVMKMLRKNLGDLTEAEQANVAANLFGQEAMSGMLSIINASDKDFKNLTDQIYNADGAAQKMADTMLNNLSGQITILKSSLEGLALQFGEIILPYVKQFVDWLQKMIQKFQGLSKEQKEQIVKWAAIAAAIGPTLLIFGKLVTGVGGFITTIGKIPGAVSKVKTGFTTLTTGLKNVSEGFTLTKAGFGSLATQAGGVGTKIGSMAASFGPWGVVIVAVIAAVTAAFVSLWKTNEEFRNNMIAIWEKIKASFEKLTDGIVERLNKLGFDFENIGEVISAVWKGFCDLLAPYFEAVFNFISIIFDYYVNTILNTIDFFIALFTGDWEGCWNAVKAQFINIWNTIKDWFLNILNAFTGIFDVVLGWFGTSWEECWGGIKDFFINIWNSIIEFFGKIVEFFKPLTDEIVGTFQIAWDIIKLVWGYVQPYFAAIWEGIKAVFSIVAEWFGAVFGVAWEKIKLVWNVVVAYFILIWENIKAIFVPVVEYFKGIFNIAWESIKAIWNVVVAYFTMIWAGIKAVFAVVKGVLSGNFTDAWDAIKNLWDKVVNYFSTIWNGIKNVFGAVISFFTNTFSAAWNAIKKIFSNVGTFFNSVWNSIKNAFTNIGTKIGSAISGAVKAGINGIIGMAENRINGFISLINGAINLINKIPGVNIGKLNKLSFPRLAKGGVVDSATFAMIGEDGKEAVVPLEKNLGWMKKLVDEFMNRLYAFFEKQIKFNESLNKIVSVCNDILEIGRQFTNDNIGYVPHTGFAKSKNVNKREEGYNNAQKEQNGDTFIFNSPKAIDEVEAARQMKLRKRELAEGY